MKAEHTMPSIVVVYHSGYGHTQRLAQAVCQNAEAALLKIDAQGALPEPAWMRLAAADLIVLGSPTIWEAQVGSSRNLPTTLPRPGWPRNEKTSSSGVFTNSGRHER